MNKNEMSCFFLGQQIGNIEVDCPALELKEWLLLCDVLKSAWRAPELAGMLDSEVADSEPDGVGEKWEVDTKSFSCHLASLSNDARCAIIEVVDQFWKHPQRRELDELELLTSIGAKICQ